MKQMPLLLFSVLLLLVGCKEEPKKIAEVEPVETVVPQVEYTISLQPYNGVWVPKNYVDSLKVSRSPFASSKYLKGINSVVIAAAPEEPKTPIKIYYGTEGEQGMIIQKDAQPYISYNTLDGTVEERLFINNNLLTFNLNGHKAELVRVADVANAKDESKGVNDVTNRVLFDNKSYSCHCPDLGGFTTNIKLNADGTAQNLFGYDNYEVATVFVSDIYPMDKIYFKNGSEWGKSYHYKLEGDKIKLFDMVINDEGAIDIKPFCVLEETQFFKLTPDEKQAYIEENKRSLDELVVSHYGEYATMGDMMEITGVLSSLKEQKDNLSFYMYVAGQVYKNKMADSSNPIGESLGISADDYFYRIFLERPELFYAYLGADKTPYLQRRLRQAVKDRLQLENDAADGTTYSDSLYNVHIQYCKGYEWSVKSVFK